jgi:predicted alpha/beta hydrolase
MGFYGSLCARTLARAHARGGDAVAISAYLGTNAKFDAAIADFSEAYADLNQRDHAAFVAAIAEGRVAAAPG